MHYTILIFNYSRKQNQRTLSFNVAIKNLPDQKSVFSGSSSEN
jgi:hypothetical protein